MSRPWWHWLVGGLALSVVIGVVSEVVVERRDRARFPPPHALVDIGGRGLYLTCSGEGSPTIVLESGGPGDSSDYAALLPQLARISRVCAYDRAGLGWSDASPEPTTAGALSDNLAALLEHPDTPPPYVLVASSAGGLPAHLYAQRHADRVVGLVFLDVLTAGMFGRAPSTERKMIIEACAARAFAHLGVLRLVDPFHLRKRAGPRRARDLAFAYRRSTWDSVCSLLMSGSESAAAIHAAPPLDRLIPMVVLEHEKLGEDAAIDPMWKAEQAKLAQESTRGEIVIAQGSGHHIRNDRPDLVVAAVKKLVEAARSRK